MRHRIGGKLFAPEGRWNVATGYVPACRDGTRGGVPILAAAPEGRRKRGLPAPYEPGAPTTGFFGERSLLGPSGAGDRSLTLAVLFSTTGFARAFRPSLHPWLQSLAPSGPPKVSRPPRLMMLRGNEES